MKAGKASPLRIDSPAGFPDLGMSLCPGKADPWARTGPARRDLREDLAAIKNWGAALIVTLMEDFELETLGVKDLGKAAMALGMEWRQWPVMDATPLRLREDDAPGQWDDQIREFAARLDQGEKIFVHCRGGLGRTGTLAARILIEKGLAPAEAVALVRQARHGAIETPEQERYILKRQWENKE